MGQPAQRDFLYPSNPTTTYGVAEVSAQKSTRTLDTRRVSPTVAVDSDQVYYIEAKISMDTRCAIRMVLLRHKDRRLQSSDSCGQKMLVMAGPSTALHRGLVKMSW